MEIETRKNSRIQTFLRKVYVYFIKNGRKVLEK